MGDGCTWLKLRMLILYRWHIAQWWREVWKQDGRQRICCDGYMCGCFGSDHASQWEWLLKDRT